MLQLDRRNFRHRRVLEPLASKLPRNLLLFRFIVLLPEREPVTPALPLPTWERRGPF
jgi:hypothetical protein